MKPVRLIHYILLIPILIFILCSLFIEKMGNALGSEKKPKNEVCNCICILDLFVFIKITI